MAPQSSKQTKLTQGATGSTGGTGQGGDIADRIQAAIDAATNRGGGSMQSVPAGAVSSGTRSAIGVEGTQVVDPMTGKPMSYFGYTVPVRVQPQGFGATKETPLVQQQQPQYFSGDEDMINKMSKENIAVVQRSLAMNGLMSTNYIPGVVDDKTRSGFRELLGIANRQGTDWNTALSTVSQVRSTTQGRGTLPKYELSNPDDLKAVFRKAAQDSLGRNLGDGDLERLVSAYQQQELQYQQKLTAGGTVQQAPSAQTFAMNAIQKDFAGEVDKRKMESIFSAVDSALSGGR